MANARLASIELAGPPTATVTNCPGRNRVAIAGATNVSAWYASIRRTVSTVPRTCTGAEAASATGRLRCHRNLGGQRQFRRVLLQGPDADLTADDRLDALDRGGQSGRGGHAHDAAAHRGGADLVAGEAR